MTGTPANLSIRARCATAWRGASRCSGRSWPRSRRCGEAIEEARGRGDDEEAERLPRELERLERRSKIIPYIDPIDVRYSRFERVPKPNTEAVMFCLMDVSGSMTEAMKDLAKRFFMLLHVFLIRRYRHVDIVFIRHTSTRRGGRRGDVLLQPRDRRHRGLDRARKDARDRARALPDRPLEHLRARRPPTATITAPTAAAACRLLGGEVLPLCQYFAYVEVGDGMGGSLTGLSRDSDLWRAYSEVAPAHPHFAMRRVGDPAQIFSVFHELFAKGGVRA